MSPELTAAFDRLETWTDALVNSVTDEVPAARAKMTEERTAPLPSGASLGSLAHMELGGTRKALNERFGPPAPRSTAASWKRAASRPSDRCPATAGSPPPARV